MNTVTGNVSRTHHPCGACGELVEQCRHWKPGYRAPDSNPRRASKREQSRRARALAAAAVAEFRRLHNIDNTPADIDEPGALP